MKLLMLAKSSMKKNRSSSITLFFLIILSTVFLYTGLLTVLNMDSFLDKKNTAVNGPDFLAIAPVEYEDKLENIIHQVDTVAALEKEAALRYNSGDIYNKRLENKPQAISFLLLNADEDRTLSQLKVQDSIGKMKENSIVLPYYLKSAFGYKAGDNIAITLEDTAYSFEIYGFSEDVIFSTITNINIYKCFLPDAAFQRLYHKATPSCQSIYMKATLIPGASSSDCDDAVVTLAGKDNTLNATLIQCLNYEVMKIGTKMTISILMIILIFFAALILVISAVVIRYSILSHIEEDIKNIGSMKAAGFTGRMLQGSLILQFLTIALLAYLVGMAIALTCSGVITGIVSASIGLNWQENLSPFCMLITLSAVLLFILAITAKVTGRIHRITPLIALRGGIDTFHFGKNRLPLATSFGNLHLLLGLKQLFTSKKRSISISIISLLMSFTLMFAFITYYNLVMDRESIVNLIGLENRDISVQCTNDQYKEVFDKAARSPGVAKALLYTQSNLTISKDDVELSCPAMICEDFSKTNVNSVYKGRYPQFDNEVVLSTVIMNKLNAKLHDVIQIKGDQNKSEYIIVGISQHITQLGKSISLTEAGMKKAYPNYQPSFQYLYLNKDADIQATIDYLTKTLADYDISIQNVREVYNTSVASISKTITMICVVIGVISTFIVMLILYYLIKVKLLREKISLGISKALGFTTRQLILQINISLCTVILFSSLIGCLMAALSTNRLFGLMMSVAGIQNFNMKVPVILIVITLSIMTLLVYILTTLVSLRIRKLKPRDLITE